MILRTSSLTGKRFSRHLLKTVSPSMATSNTPPLPRTNSGRRPNVRLIAASRLEAKDR